MFFQSPNMFQPKCGHPQTLSPWCSVSGHRREPSPACSTQTLPVSSRQTNLSEESKGGNHSPSDYGGGWFSEIDLDLIHKSFTTLVQPGENQFSLKALMVTRARETNRGTHWEVFKQILVSDSCGCQAKLINIIADRTTNKQ